MRQFTIRTVLTMTFMVAFFCALPLRNAIEQKRGREWVASQRGHVQFRDSAPHAVSSLLGADMFNPVCGVTLDCEQLSDISPITQLPSLEVLGIDIYMVNDIDLSPLKELPRLKQLYLSQWSGVSKEQLIELRQMLPAVEIISESHPKR